MSSASIVPSAIAFPAATSIADTALTEAPTSVKIDQTGHDATASCTTASVSIRDVYTPTSATFRHIHWTLNDIQKYRLCCVISTIFVRLDK